MSKFLIRLMILLLVPSLGVNPTLATALAHIPSSSPNLPPPLSATRGIESFFVNQALTLELTSSDHLGLKRGEIVVSRTGSRLWGEVQTPELHVWRTFFRSLLKGETGLSLIEYHMILAAPAIGIVAAALWFFGISGKAARRAVFLWKNFANPLWHRDLKVLFSGSFIANVGFGLHIGAEPFLIYTLTGSSSAVGQVAMAIPLGLALFAPYGGILAEHLSEKDLVTIQWLRSMSPLILGILIVLATTGIVPPGLVIFCAWMTGVGQGIGFPLYQRMLKSIVKDQPQEEQDRALGRNQTQSQLGRAAGTFLDSLWLPRYGAGPSFLWGAGSFMIFALCISRLHTVLPKKSGIIREQIRNSAKESRYALKEDPTFLFFLILLAVSSGMGYPIFSLLAPAVDRLLHQPELWLGLASWHIMC